MKKKLACMVLAAAMFCTMTTAAYYESPIPAYYNGSYGKTYKVTSILYEDSSTSFRGSVWAQTEDSTNVPVGTIGCLAMLCDGESGEAFYTGDWSYNPSQDYFHSAVTPKKYWNRTVFAKGLVRVGTGQDEPAPESPARGTARSVSALLHTLTEDHAYPVNAQGETYGSILLTGVTNEIPDLISARNESGVSGYIRHDDLSPADTGRDGLAAYYAAVDADNTIPLYDLDGIVIGSYEIGKNEEVEFDTTDIEAAKAAVEAAAAGGGSSKTDIEAVKRSLDRSSESKSSTNVTIAPDVFMARLREKYLVDGAYPTTADGKTYGPSGLIPHVHPDLVSVVATNGESGYVKFEEFDPYTAFLSNPDTTPEEEISAREHLPELADTPIPVYDLDGNVVGEFIRYATR